MRLLSVRLVAAACTLALPAISLAQPAAKPAPTAGAPRPPAAAPPKPGALKLPTLEQFTLENGLRVAYMHQDAAPVVAVEVWYHVGSKDEPRDRRGSAHMFEHMMFKGTERVRPEAHGQFISRVGGEANAHTTEDATAYVQVVPADQLDFVLALEAERMRHLLFRDDMIATEREVVKEEIRQQENDPVTQGLLRFLQIAFTAHPYAWTAGGTIADLDRTTSADLRRFYDAYYQPSNALVVVVGAVPLAEVKALVEQRFGAIPAGAAPPRPADATPEPVQTARRHEVVDPGQIGIVFAGWKIPAAKHPDVYALQILSLIMGAGDSSRLRVRIKGPDPKRKEPLGVEAASPILVREHPGLFLAIGVYRDPAATDAVEAAIQDELTKVGAKPVPADELRKAKNQVLAAFVFGLDSPLGLAEQIGQSWILTGDAGQFLVDVDAIERVTAADVARVAKTYLTPERATVVVVPPRSAP
ncbi:MAG: insulinase family protein [Myxococcales bacterium]|nr:insulinase family protein [Myxococcales bacterium]